MEIHETVAGLRLALAKAGRVAFVPTMGNLHEGHMALLSQARQQGDAVVASIFVNRLQFGPKEDFASYPRTFQADCDKMGAVGVDHVFAPPESEIYPVPQRYFVEPGPEEGNILEGEFRPGFFRGVATVVAKFFNIVQPQVALFGKKDFQQFVVIRNMVRELALPMEIVAGETVRADDGLALSSRNGYLSSAERAEAPRLHRVLHRVRQEIRDGARDYVRMESAAQAELEAHGWRPQYISVRRSADLQPPTTADSGLVVLAAAFLGTTRLIDNLEV